MQILDFTLDGVRARLAHQAQVPAGTTEHFVLRLPSRTATKTTLRIETDAPAATLEALIANREALLAFAVAPGDPADLFVLAAKGTDPWTGAVYADVLEAPADALVLTITAGASDAAVRIGGLQ